MRNLKRVLSLALALVMVLGMMVIGTSAATFTDAEQITETEAVEVMAALGILKGDNGAFNPKGTLNRAGAAKLIAFMTMGAEADSYLAGSTAVFTDVPADHWAAKYIAYCSNLKIINGNGDDTFNPNGNISTVGFAKLVLGAAGVAGTYTGAGWEDNVKKAAEDADLDVVTIDGTDITREEAAALMLAGMKYTAENAGWIVKEAGANGKTVKKFADVADAIIYTATLNAAAGAGSFEYAAAPATGYLLNTVYGVSFGRSTDDFGRPGVRYTNAVTKLNMFYADTPVATYEGPVTEETLFAASGYAVKAPTATSFTYTLIEDGSDFHGTKTAAKAKQATAKWTAAGTGEGIKTELYKQFDVAGNPVYTLVAIRDYMGTVTTVTPATEDDARSIKVTLDKCSTGYESTKVTLAYETEAFALNEKVLVNVSYAAGGPEIQAISYPGVAEGKVTKITDKGVYTIGGNDYVLSQNWVGTAPVLNTRTAGSWYVDSQGNLIAVKTPGTVTNEWNYGYLIQRQTSTYAAGDLLGTSATENAEKFEIFTAEGKKVVYDGAFTVNAQNVPTFVGGSVTANELVRYTLVDGKIKKIENVVKTEGSATGNDGTTLSVGKADADLLNNGSVVVNDNTLFFAYVPAVEGVSAAKYAVYTGYKALPTAGLSTSAEYEFFYVNKANNTADTTVAAAVFMQVASITTSEQSRAKLVWFANTDNYTSKNADGNTVYTYTNVYYGDVKGEISFETEVEPTVNAGWLYLYKVDSVSGYAVLDYTNPYGDAGNEGRFDTTCTVSKVENGYYVTNHSSVKVVYVDEDTEYYQVDETTKAVTKVEALPAVSATGAYTIKQIHISSEYEGLSAIEPIQVVYFYVDMP